MNNEELLDAALKIAGRKIAIQNKIVSFGEGNQIGDIAIQDVAGGDIFKPIVNIQMNTSLTEKQAEAFSSIYRLISRQNEIINEFSDFLKLCRNETVFVRTVGQVVDGEYPKTIFDDFKRGRKDFEKAYNSQRVYVPKHIDKKIQEYKEAILWGNSLDKASSYDYILSHIQKVIHNKEYYADIILSDMHEFIFLNTNG